MTQPLPIVGKLPIKTLVAKQLPTNAHSSQVPRYTIIYSGLTGSSYYYPSIRSSFPHSNLVLFHTTCTHSCTLWRYVCPVFVFPILSCTHPECHLLIPIIIIQMISVSYEMIQRSLPLMCKWDQLTSPPTQKIRDEKLTVSYSELPGCIIKHEYRYPSHRIIVA